MYALRKTTPLAVALGLMLALLFGVLAMFGGERAKATHVEPTFKAGNPTCSQLVTGVAGLKELKVEPVADGTYSDGTLTVTIDVRDTADGPVFDFTSNISVLAVFVKGGPGGNLYDYRPNGVTSDTGLHAPVNPNNDKFYGLSHISFCYVPTGNVKIIKTDDAGKPLAGAEFTLYKNNPPLDSRGNEDTITSFKCTTGANGTCTITNVPPGEYWLVETKVPAGHDGVADQRVTVQGGKTVTVGPLKDPRHRGAIKVTKTAKHKGPGSPNLQATFTVKKNNEVVGTITTDPVTGKGCLDNLLLGDYTVTETSGPSGYKLDPDVEPVTVDNKASCSDNPFGGETVSFENTPLTDITVSINSQVDGGTASTVECVPDGPSGSTGANGDGTFTDTDLPPGTYTCEIVIDP